MNDADEVRRGRQPFPRSPWIAERAYVVDGSIAPRKIATACHTPRDAVTIEVQYGNERWQVENQIGSVLHDLCVLSIETAELPLAEVRADELRPGEPLSAAGFQGGGPHLIVSRSVVAGLYRFDGGNIVRTTASFDFGSSGGGLFDDAGRLVGILAFKGRAGKNLRFALPTAWLSPVSPVAQSFVPKESSTALRALWEHVHRPAFLGVAIRDAAADTWSEPQ